MTKQRAYSEKRFREYYEDDLSITLRNKGGSYGGGSEVLVVQRVYDRNIDHACREFEDVCETIRAAYGEGGSATAIVVMRTTDEDIQSDKPERNI